MEDKGKGEAEDRDAWEDAVPALEACASVNPAESVSRISREHPATKYHAPLAGKK